MVQVDSHLSLISLFFYWRNFLQKQNWNLQIQKKEVILEAFNLPK
jgi:hypothetical protein